MKILVLKRLILLLFLSLPFLANAYCVYDQIQGDDIVLTNMTVNDLTNHWQAKTKLGGKHVLCNSTAKNNEAILIISANACFSPNNTDGYCNNIGTCRTRLTNKNEKVILTSSYYSPYTLKCTIMNN